MSDDFAVIELNSKQFLVTPGIQFKVDRIDTNSPIEVLLSNVGGNLLVGEPFVSDVGVKLEILEDKKDKKVEVRRYKSKSRYRKNKGHRQPISIIKVIEIKKGVKSEIKIVGSAPEGKEKPKEKGKPQNSDSKS